MYTAKQIELKISSVSFKSGNGLQVFITVNYLWTTFLFTYLHFYSAQSDNFSKIIKSGVLSNPISYFLKSQEILSGYQ